MSGAKGTVIGVASGAAGAVVSGYAQTAIPFLSTAGWWAMPAAVALVGHFLKRRNPTIGGALTGIAGFMAYGNFVASHATKGLDYSSAGAMPGAWDAGMLHNEPGAVRYIDSPGTVASLGTAAAHNAGMLYNHETMGMGDAGELYD